MAKKSKFQRNVDPRIAAVLIVGTLAVVQYAWWQGLVAKPKVNSPGAGGAGGGGGAAEIVLTGDPAARVDTIAGGLEPGDADGAGSAARFDGPSGIAMAPNGSLVIADSRNNRIREMAPLGRTSTIAGSYAGYRDGAATTALFDEPTGVAVASDGAVYVADTLNHRIRRIMNGVVTTIAGGAPGYVDGPGPTARFYLPAGIARVTAPGGQESLLVADTGNRRLRLVTLKGGVAVVGTLAAVKGHPTCVAEGANPSSVAATAPDSGTIRLSSSKAAYVEQADTIVEGYEGEGPENELPRLTDPIGITAAPEGWYVIDGRHGALFVVSDGHATVLAGRSMKSHPVFDYGDGDGLHALFGLLGGVTADGHGRVYVSDLSNNCIRRITLPGTAPAGSAG